MQKRDQSKQGGASGGGYAAPPAKRGRPFGSSNSNNANAAAIAAVAADTPAPSTLLGPSLQLSSSFAGQSCQNPSFYILLTVSPEMGQKSLIEAGFC